MTKFIFLRHGQTNWNLQHRYQGSSNIPLNDTGLLQAEAAHEMLTYCHFDEVYCSDLNRAMVTAKIAIGDLFPLDRIHYDRRLRERSFGVYEGGPYDKDKVPEVYRVAMDADPEGFKFPEGESLLDLADRARPFYQEMLKKYPDKTILLVSHGSFLSILTQIINHEEICDKTRVHYQNALPIFIEAKE